MKHSRYRLLAAAALCWLTGAAWAHHSYAMFDGSKVVTVKGVIAKLDWSNPHVFIWVHVPNPQATTGYDLYAFENGSTNVLARRGWSAQTLKPGEKVTVDYWPLRDGRNGGHFVRAVHEDGSISWGVGGPNGANGAREAASAK